ncbi:hypothetical protein SDC9_193831 [bioreactor metagenome]|uniref:Uncharacterized protein n=1 Tax=bioreactor metagenome TaxID=1076179 RepID=A0A645I4R1_9ZZZZ
MRSSVFPVLDPIPTVSYPVSGFVLAVSLIFGIDGLHPEKKNAVPIIKADKTVYIKTC